MAVKTTDAIPTLRVAAESFPLFSHDETKAIIKKGMMGTKSLGTAAGQAKMRRDSSNTKATICGYFLKTLGKLIDGLLKKRTAMNDPAGIMPKTKM